jgi:hypothetical protein
MEDILFDTILREVPIVNGDFELTQNPSTQNGGILLEARAYDVYQPIYGIGIQYFMNGNLINVNAQMNRWVAQVKQDGGLASFNSLRYIDGGLAFNSNVNYPQ